MKGVLFPTIIGVALLTSLSIAEAAPDVGRKLSVNGPALDGRRVALPAGSALGGAPLAGEVRHDDGGIRLNGATLDGRRVSLSRS